MKAFAEGRKEREKHMAGMLTRITTPGIYEAGLRYVLMNNPQAMKFSLLGSWPTINHQHPLRLLSDSNSLIPTYIGAR